MTWKLTSATLSKSMYRRWDIWQKMAVNLRVKRKKAEKRKKAGVRRGPRKKAEKRKKAP